MTYKLKDELNKKERFAQGHRLCAGCGAGVAVSAVLRALDEEDKAVVSNATSCLEVSTFIYPDTAYEDSYIHSAFENAAAMTGGVETAYRVLKNAARSMRTSNSSASAATAAPMISGCSPCPAQWSADTIWFMSAMTTRPI